MTRRRDSKKKMKGKEAVVIVWLLLVLVNNKVKGTWSQFYHQRGRLIFQEEFDFLNTSRWQHIITAWRGGNNEFEYYTDRPENRYFLFLNGRLQYVYIFFFRFKLCT